jgi:hypothetical protein
MLTSGLSPRQVNNFSDAHLTFLKELPQGDTCGQDTPSFRIPKVDNCEYKKSVLSEKRKKKIHFDSADWAMKLQMNVFRKNIQNGQAALQR